MKKWITVVLCLIMTFSVLCSFAPSTTFAAAKKVSLTINGAKYYGEVKNGKPHGKGTMKWTNNSYDPNDNVYVEDQWITKTYSGTWVNGKRSGQGKYVIEKPYDALETYEGKWGNDKQNGYGVTIFQHGSDEEGYDVEMGQFADNEFVSGYTGYSDVTGYYMEYLDSETFIHFDLPYRYAREFLSGNFKHGGDIYGFIYQKKQKNGVIKGAEYRKSMMVAWENSIYEGTYTSLAKLPSSKYINGKLKQENYNMSDTSSNTGIIETYKYVNGKGTLVERKVVAKGLANEIKEKISGQLFLLRPHLGGFTKTFNLMMK
ncbi:hypothetical protein [Saccharibacillus qingshengii]|uniref:hypothetical protein n=1 Tax=Saccharibacillus qingshengii TaxID=1763540 RepID=UPI00155729B0|nr:hypothetical protein [Saccharibacillus qingshengii]